MIAVDDAKRLVAGHVPRGEVIRVPLDKSDGCVLAAAVTAKHDLPLDTSSAMDGFALRHADTAAASREAPVGLRVTRLVCAGDPPPPPLQPGETVRIMTGAMLPEGATAVVPQETVGGGETAQIHVTGPVVRGAHVRRQGEIVRRGDTVLDAGTVLTPAAIGHLASLGEYAVEVYAPPRVNIVPTGSELVRDAGHLRPGKIFESNAHALAAAIRRMGLVPRVFPPVADRTDHLGAVLRECFAGGDITIVSGGVSVGAKDLVREVLDGLEVIPVFWQVAQKPGKPLYLGMRGRHVVFGVPGNPAASLVCFFEYVRPALLQWLGYHDIWPAAGEARLAVPVANPAGRTHWLGAIAELRNSELMATPLPDQASHSLCALVRANCLVVVPADVAHCAAGERLVIHWLETGRII